MQSNEDRLKPLKAFVSSHFMYNVLSKLQAEILKENKKEALNALNLYSKLIRTTYNICEKPTITLKEEKEFIELYLKLEKLRFSESNFEFTISGFDNEKISIEPFSIQPFVEFAVLAGIGHSDFYPKIFLGENDNCIVIKSEIQNFDSIEKLSAKRKIAEIRLLNNNRRYEITQEENRYLQKIYINNEKQ